MSAGPGSIFDVTGYNAPPNSVVVISYGVATQSLSPLPGGCTSMIALTSLNLDTITIADQYGNYAASITLPSGTTANFARLALQAVFLPTLAPLGVDLSNTLLVTVR